MWITFLFIVTVIGGGYLLYLLFREDKTPQVSNKEKTLNYNFSIEYYPITNIYFAKYGRMYLDTDSTKGIVKLIEPYLWFYADQFRKKEDAEALIEKYKEQQLKVNVINIPYVGKDK